MGDGVCDTLEWEETYPKMVTFKEVPIGAVFSSFDGPPNLWKKHHRRAATLLSNGKQEYFANKTVVNLIYKETL